MSLVAGDYYSFRVAKGRTCLGAVHTGQTGFPSGSAGTYRNYVVALGPSLSAPMRGFRGASALSSQAYVGHSPSYMASLLAGRGQYFGSLAMLQLYGAALPESSLVCVFESGRQLIQTGRMAQVVPSRCRAVVQTGCTSQAVPNGFELSSPAVTVVDDKSCDFTPHNVPGEHGIMQVTNSWQHLSLAGRYHRPLLFCGAVFADGREHANATVIPCMRPGPLGNPFVVSASQGVVTCVALYARLLDVGDIRSFEGTAVISPDYLSAAVDSLREREVSRIAELVARGADLCNATRLVLGLVLGRT